VAPFSVAREMIRDSTDAKVPHPTSICHRCAARRYVRGRGTVFVMCTALPVKYPPRPVVRCEALRPKA